MEEKLTQKEVKAMGEAVMELLWSEWFNSTPDKEEMKEENKAVKKFADSIGCSDKAPIAWLYRGFRIGASKGLDLAIRMDKIQ